LRLDFGSEKSTYTAESSARSRRPWSSGRDSLELPPESELLADIRRDRVRALEVERTEPQKFGPLPPRPGGPKRLNRAAARQIEQMAASNWVG
jgi:hypothetical protein